MLFDYITRRLLVKEQLFLVCICVTIGSVRTYYYMDNCMDDSSEHVHDVDPDHLFDYPFCGSINYDFKEESEPSIRAANTNKTDDESLYRWLVIVETRAWKTDNSPPDDKSNPYRFFCAGAVITER